MIQYAMFNYAVLCLHSFINFFERKIWGVYTRFAEKGFTITVLLRSLTLYIVQRVFAFPGTGPRPSICIFRPQLSVCFYQPWYSICVWLFFILQLKFVIVTVCTYINSAPNYMYLLFEYNVGKNELFEISSQEIFSIFLIGYNWLHSLHFHFQIHLFWYNNKL